MAFAENLASTIAAIRDRFIAIQTRLVPPGGSTGQVLAKASATDNDVSWITPAVGGGGGSSAWGGITGTLSDQTDLSSALGAKADQTSLDALAPKASPTFTGVPAAPTAAAGTNTTQLATTAFVAALGALKANLASPALTGTPTAPTASTVTSNTQIATTAYVKGQGYATLASPALSGTPTAPTAAAGTNSTQIASTGFVVASYAPIANPTLTGTPAAPTAGAGTNTTQIATTSFVQTALPPKGFTTFCAGKPTASEVIGGVISPYAFSIVASNCVFRANVAAAASTVFTILMNGTQIGTATFAANATTASVSISNTTVAQGAFLTIVAPATPDANLGDIAAIVRA